MLNLKIKEAEKSCAGNFLSLHVILDCLDHWFAYVVHINGLVAQRLEQATHNRLVPGSNPGEPTNFKPNPSYCGFVALRCCNCFSR